jgi:hypothetical protein
VDDGAESGVVGRTPGWPAIKVLDELVFQWNLTIYVDDPRRSDALGQLEQAYARTTTEPAGCRRSIARGIRKTRTVVRSLSMVT